MNNSRIFMYLFNTLLYLNFQFTSIKIDVLKSHLSSLSYVLFCKLFLEIGINARFYRYLRNKINTELLAKFHQALGFSVGRSFGLKNFLY